VGFCFYGGFNFLAGNIATILLELEGRGSRGCPRRLEDFARNEIIESLVYGGANKLIETDSREKKKN
jgi:hypothetical protein